MFLVDNNESEIRQGSEKSGSWSDNHIDFMVQDSDPVTKSLSIGLFAMDAQGVWRDVPDGIQKWRSQSNFRGQDKDSFFCASAQRIISW